MIVEERDMYDTFLRDLIRPGQDEGIICPDIEPKLAAITILGMLNWIYHWYRPGGELSASRDRERVRRLRRRGPRLRPRDAHAGPPEPARSAAARARGVRGERAVAVEVGREEVSAPQAV